MIVLKSKYCTVWHKLFASSQLVRSGLHGSDDCRLVPEQDLDAGIIFARTMAARRLNRDPFDLVQGDFVACAVIELCRPRTFVSRHRLCVFQRTPIAEVRGDSRRAKGMATQASSQSRIGRASLNHAIGANPVHRFLRQGIRFADSAAEEGRSSVATNAGSGNIFIQILFQLVMRRHFVALATFS